MSLGSQLAVRFSKAALRRRDPTTWLILGGLVVLCASLLLYGGARWQTGQIAAQAEAQQQSDKAALLDRLRARGLLPAAPLPDEVTPTPAPTASPTEAPTAAETAPPLASAPPVYLAVQAREPAVHALADETAPILGYLRAGDWLLPAGPAQPGPDGQPWYPLCLATEPELTGWLPAAAVETYPDEPSARQAAELWAEQFAATTAPETAPYLVLLENASLQAEPKRTAESLVELERGRVLLVTGAAALDERGQRWYPILSGATDILWVRAAAVEPAAWLSDALALGATLAEPESPPPVAARHLTPLLPTAEPALAPPVAPPPVPPARRLGPPRWLEIPRIAVDSPVVAMDHDGDAYKVPPFAVGFVPESALPGAAGPSVLLGHVTSPEAGKVFARLAQLRPGDRLRLYAEEAVTDWQVVELRAIRPGDPAALPDDDSPTLNLLTCTGAYSFVRQDFNQRLLVVARPA